MQVLESPPASQSKEEDKEDDLPELPWVTLATALPDGTDLDDKNNVQTATRVTPPLPSPPMMKPKSYAAVAKPSVVTAAPPQRAAVPKLSAAASMPSTDLKPSATAFKLAADTTSLKVSICYVCTHNGRKWSFHVMCSIQCTWRGE